jgi:acetate kinase
LRRSRSRNCSVLLADKRMSIEHLQHLLYEQSGLLGLSGLSPSMEDLLAQLSDPTTVEAVEFYCYQARWHLVALNNR